MCKRLVLTAAVLAGISLQASAATELTVYTALEPEQLTAY
jgi:iron(III) transport system substrate-binding protein